MPGKCWLPSLSFLHFELNNVNVVFNISEHLNVYLWQDLLLLPPCLAWLLASPSRMTRSWCWSSHCWISEAWQRLSAFRLSCQYIISILACLKFNNRPMSSLSILLGLVLFTPGCFMISRPKPKEERGNEWLYFAKLGKHWSWRLTHLQLLLLWFILNINNN